MAEIDNRYCRGMIYTIRNIKDDAMIYVGSTINTLSKRFDNHKRDCKTNKLSLYSYIENSDWTDWYIELYEAYPCNNKKELNRREGEVIREIGTINKNIAGRTKKEYYKDNFENIKERSTKNYYSNIKKKKEYNNNYYKENTDKILEQKKIKGCCNICGALCLKASLIRHQKTKKCMSKSLDNTDIPTDNHI